MPSGRIFRKYNPGTYQSDDEVSGQFVVRHRELRTVLHVLRENACSQVRQHVLIVAPRGLGKTMLLARVEAELRVNKTFSQHLVPVRFMEESQEIFSPTDFWLEVLFYLAKESASRNVDVARELQAAHVNLASRWQGNDMEERVRATVLNAAEQLGKRLVLMVENLQTLCGDADDDFGWSLRRVLQTEPRITLLATATSYFKGLDDEEQPFFGLFRTINLEPLTTEECRELWQRVSNSDHEKRDSGTIDKDEIRPLEILTGGNPRLLIIVGEFARRRSLKQLMENLVDLMDSHTEYFRGHLERLASRERRVYLAVVDLWQPSSASEIVARARMDVRMVSALLGRLVERGMVVVEGSGRKRLYSAAERLYSIYYKLRRERDKAAVVRNLIHFMDAFYGNVELAEMSASLMREAEQSPDIREGIRRAINERPEIDSIFLGAVQPTLEGDSSRSYSVDFRRCTRLANELSPVHVATAMVCEALNQEQHGRTEAAIATYDEVAERFGESDTPAVQEQVAEALINKALTQRRVGQTESAIATYDEVIERYGQSSTLSVQRQAARALGNKALAQGQLGRTEASFSTYDVVVERYGESDAPAMQEPVAKALVNKALAQDELGQTDAAISTCDAVVERYGGSDTPAVQEPVAKALFIKAFTQDELGQIEAAISTCDAVVERYGGSDTPAVQASVAKALVNKAVAQTKLGRTEAAISTYEAVVERYGESDAPAMQEPVAKALVNKAVDQTKLGRTEAAISTCDAVVERYGGSDTPGEQEPVARALFIKAFAQEQLGQTEAAISTYGSVVERYGESDLPVVQEVVAKALCKKALVQGQLGRTEAAISTCDAVVERYGESDTPAMQEPVAKALVNKAVAQTKLGRTEAAISTCEAVVERYSGSDMSAVQELVAEALVNKALTQGRLGQNEAAISAYDAVVERHGESDLPAVQEWVAGALFNKALTQVQLGRIEAAVSTCEAVVERYGESDSQAVQEVVADALVNKALTQEQLGRTEAAISTCDAVVERYGETDFPAVQRHTARALVNKAVALGRLGRTEDAISIYDEVIERYGENNASELQEIVVMSLCYKSSLQIKNVCREEALHTYSALDGRLEASSKDCTPTVEWRARWLRVEILLVCGELDAAMSAYRCAYAAAGPSDEHVLREPLLLALQLIAAGVSEHAVIGILSGDGKKSEILMPLVVALRQRMGEVVRGPSEVLEVAADIQKRIEVLSSEISS